MEQHCQSSGLWWLHFRSSLSFVGATLTRVPGLSGKAIRQHVKLLKKKHFGTKAAGTPDPPVKSDEQENAENILGKNPNPVRILPSRKRTVQKYVESEDTEEDEYIVSESPTKKVKSEDVGPA